MKHNNVSQPPCIKIEDSDSGRATISPPNFGNYFEGAHAISSKVFLKEFDIQENQHFVQYVFMPYFKDIYKDLSARSDKPAKGINRLIFIEVSIYMLK